MRVYTNVIPHSGLWCSLNYFLLPLGKQITEVFLLRNGKKYQFSVHKYLYDINRGFIKIWGCKQQNLSLIIIQQI